MMPDHIHLFVAGSCDFDLGVWVRGLKRVVAAAVAGGRAEKDSDAETAAATTIRPISVAGFWQRGFFDHLLRDTGEATHRNGTMFEKIRFAPNWSRAATPGNIRGEIAIIDRV